MKITRVLWIVLVTCVLLLAGNMAMGAAAAPTQPAGAAKTITMWKMIKDGGLVGAVIILGSFCMIGLVIEHFVSIRASKLIPEDLELQLQQLLEQKQYKEAQTLCGQHDSLLARIIESGLEQAGSAFGYFDMQSAMQETSEREVGKLFRKLEWLAFIATTSPMFGLLGTVTGMIASFNTIALKGGRPSPTELAGGISQALVTTCMGLIVAIPGIFFVGFFRSRIDAIVAETGAVVEHLMGRFKKGPAR